MKNEIIPYQPYLRNFARQLRKNSTLSEVLLWQKIKQRSFGVQFHRQVPMLNYIVDFYCHELKLAIEIDGNSHNFKYFEDKHRQNRLERYGVHFLRFSDEEVKKDMFSVEMSIREKIIELGELHPPNPPSRGETQPLMILEICANGFESAQIAQKAGANRIELCENLPVGGITASYALIEKVVGELDIETHVLIRPRSGDFCYSEDELQGMERDIAFCKAMGCTGVVTGVLTAEGDLNMVATQRLLEVSQGMEFTFHRAIDVAKNPKQLFEGLIELEVTRVLSSGGKPTAEQGLSLLKKFKEISGGKLQVMPGGGITSQNVFQFKKAGFQMIHTSATQKTTLGNSKDLMYSSSKGFSSAVEIRKIKAVLS